MTSTVDSLSTRLADSIVALIETDGKTEGDPIPSARALSERFEVTTPTVREALRRLEATGVVVFRHGSGTFVGPGHGRGLVANPHVTASHRSVLELIEARLVIEPSIAASAAAHRTDRDLEDLRAACENSRRSDEVPETSAHFHAVLARATGNRVLADALEAMLAMNRRQRRILREEFIVPKTDHAEHLALVEAVRQRDAETARFLAAAHLRALRQAVRTQLEAETGPLP